MSHTEGENPEKQKTRIFTSEKRFSDFPDLAIALIDIEQYLPTALEACSMSAWHQGNERAGRSIARLRDGLREIVRHPALMLVNAPLEEIAGEHAYQEVYVHMATSNENFPVVLSVPAIGQKEVYMFPSEPDGGEYYPGIWLRETTPRRKSPRRSADPVATKRGIQIGCLDFADHDPIPYIDPTPSYSFISNEFRRIHAGIRKANRKMQFSSLSHGRSQGGHRYI